jgi:hypothetical protein
MLTKMRELTYKSAEIAIPFASLGFIQLALWFEYNTSFHTTKIFNTAEVVTHG